MSNGPVACTEVTDEHTCVVLSYEACMSDSGVHRACDAGARVVIEVTTSVGGQAPSIQVSVY